MAIIDVEALEPLVGKTVMATTTAVPDSWTEGRDYGFETSLAPRYLGKLIEVTEDEIVIENKDDEDEPFRIPAAIFGFLTDESWRDNFDTGDSDGLEERLEFQAEVAALINRGRMRSGPTEATPIRDHPSAQPVDAARETKEAAWWRRALHRIRHFGFDTHA